VDQWLLLDLRLRCYPGCQLVHLLVLLGQSRCWPVLPVQCCLWDLWYPVCLVAQLVQCCLGCQLGLWLLLVLCCLAIQLGLWDHQLDPVDQHRPWDQWDHPEDQWDLWHLLVPLYQERLVLLLDLCPEDPWDLWHQYWWQNLRRLWSLCSGRTCGTTTWTCGTSLALLTQYGKTTWLHTVVHSHCQAVRIHGELALPTHIDVAVHAVVLVANYACGIHYNLML